MFHVCVCLQKKEFRDYQWTLKAHSLTVCMQHDKTLVDVLIQIIRTISKLNMGQ
jgi:hypothetical protein